MANLQVKKVKKPLTQGRPVRALCDA